MTIVKNLAGVIHENSPKILSSLAVAGLISTSILAVKATPKALWLREQEECRGSKQLSKREVIRVTWKCYIPAATVGLASIVCIVQANTISQRRIAAVAGAYTIAERALKEYQSKVVETFGRHKELKVRDDIAADRIKENPPGPNEVVLIGTGEVLCYDSQTGRYFKSSVEQIRQAVNRLNHRLLSEMFISLNEFFYEIGLSETKIGDDVGWNVEKGLIEVRFSTQLSENQEPCLVLEYEVTPRYMK